MKSGTLGLIADLEDSLWWYRGLRANVLHHLQRGLKPGSKVLDAGCGTGALELEGHDFHRLDQSEESITILQKKKRKAVVRGSADALPYGDGSFDAAISLDVWYHSGIESTEKAALEHCRVLKPGGLLVLNLPAYDALRGGHDEAIATRERYRRSDLIARLQASGFEIEKATYWNCLLFPLAFLKRKLGNRSDAPEAKTDLEMPGKMLNAVLSSVLAFENAIIRLGLSWPFGLSVFVIARKENP